MSNKQNDILIEDLFETLEEIELMLSGQVDNEIVAKILTLIDRKLKKRG